MVKKSTPQGPQEPTVPSEFPQTLPPRDLHPTTDIRFVIYELGTLSVKIERLITDTKETSDKVSELSRKVSHFQIAASIIAGCIVVVGGLLWYVFGDVVRLTINNSVRAAILDVTKPAPQMLVPSATSLPADKPHE